MLEPRWRPVQGHIGENPFDNGSWGKEHFQPSTVPWQLNPRGHGRPSDDGIMDHDTDGDGAINLSTSQRPSAATTPNGDTPTYGQDQQDNDQDPAIRRAVTSTPATRGLEDYNPFAEQGTQGTTQVRGAVNPPIYGGVGATQQPATLQPTNQEAPPPAYARTPQQTVNAALGSSLSPSSDQRAEPEWKARAEEELRNTPYYPRRNNWPPLPDKCCFQPCFYQDIDVEIHTDFQKIVRQLYYLWMFHGCVLLLNVIGGFVLMLCNQNFSAFGLAILYLILFTPFSFMCWFRPAYRAFKNDSSFNFMVFFFVFFFQLIVTSIQAIGIPGAGTCGIITAISTLDSTAEGIFVGLLMLFIAIGFLLAAGGDLLLLSKIHRIYRNSDASVTKAQQEFATTFLRNEHVQNAASNVAASAVRSQMANANQPRY